MRKAYQSLTSYFHVVLEFTAVVVGFYSFLLLMYLEARTFVMMKIYCHIIYILKKGKLVIAFCEGRAGMGM